MQNETERKVRMEINIEKLKETVIERNTTLEALAYEMGINRSTLYRKLRRGPAAISLLDAKTISKSLRLSPREADSIFGGGYVSHM
jgi:DNA-binding phage protein